MPATVNGYNVQRAVVNATADGDNTVIAAPGAGKSILVLGGRLRAVGAATLVILKSGAGGTVHADFNAAAAAPGAVLQLPSDAEVGVFLGDVGASLVINNTAGVDTFGFLAYRII
jgi:hypothetical protein